MISSGRRGRGRGEREKQKGKCQWKKQKKKKERKKQREKPVPIVGRQEGSKSFKLVENWGLFEVEKTVYIWGFSGGGEWGTSKKQQY